MLNDITHLIYSIGTTFLLITIIFFTYKKVYKGDEYKFKFNVCLAVMVLITTMIITLIKNSLNTSLGLLGIISIIRFRIKLKDFRDVGFILWGIGAGVAIGTGNYLVGFVYTFVISVFFIFLNEFSEHKKKDYVLVVRALKINEEKLEKILKKECLSYKKISFEEKEGYVEYIYNVETEKYRKLREKLVEKIELDFIKLI